MRKGARPKEGRPLMWTALKGSEKDLLRKLYSNWQRIPEGAEIPLILQPGATVDQDWGEIPEAVRAEGAEAIESYARLSAGTRAVVDRGPMSPAEALAALEEEEREQAKILGRLHRSSIEHETQDGSSPEEAEVVHINTEQ